MRETHFNIAIAPSPQVRDVGGYTTRIINFVEAEIQGKMESLCLWHNINKVSFSLAGPYRGYATVQVQKAIALGHCD